MGAYAFTFEYISCRKTLDFDFLKNFSSRQKVASALLYDALVKKAGNSIVYHDPPIGSFGSLDEFLKSRREVGEYDCDIVFVSGRYFDHKGHFGNKVTKESFIEMGKSTNSIPLVFPKGELEFKPYSIS